MSGFWTRSREISWAASLRLTLCSPAVAGRKSATAAAMTTMSAEADSVDIADASCCADSTRTTRTPAGRSVSTAPATSVTVAPRERAVRASATPCRPLLMFPMKRTGSHASRVPPALITMRWPARSFVMASPRRRTSRAAATIAGGSGSRPGPESAPVRRPTAGSNTRMPRSRRDCTLACVAGCCHISVCMAGAIMIGQVAVSRVLVRRSSASPWVALAMRSAVAGTTSTRSADLPSRTCGTACTPRHTVVETGLPDRAAHVASPTNFKADAVGTTVTSHPASVRPRKTSQAL